MDKKWGFIGCGNMARAVMGSMLGAHVAAPEQITASDISEASLADARRALGIVTTTNNREAAERSDTIFIAVKPQMMQYAIASIADVVADDKLIISFVAGQSMETIERAFGKRVKLIRLMPNTPALVSAGMTAACRNDLVSDEELELVMSLLRKFGLAEVVSEKMMDVVTGLSGSGPAYVFMFIEALADGAVREGMPRAQAYTFAAQTVMGSAKMVLDTGRHPGDLKDMVCSPAGTTIEGVAALEQDGFRGAAMRAVSEATRRSRELGEHK